jgi:hypothetical protein
MQHEAFTSGKFDTHFVGKYFNAESLKNSREEEAMLAAITAVLLLKDQKAASHIEAAPQESNWLKNRKKYS